MTAPEPAPPPRAGPCRRPGTPAPQAPHEAALQLLGLLQRDARFIDFIEEDVRPTPDADIGGAARVVHEGLPQGAARASLSHPAAAQRGRRQPHHPCPKVFDAAAVRVTGNVVGRPFTGTLSHRGWRVTDTRLPSSPPATTRPSSPRPRWSCERPRYAIGIDLGTTHCAPSYGRDRQRRRAGGPAGAGIPQLTGPGAVEARLLPSFPTCPTRASSPPATWRCPGPAAQDFATGEFAAPAAPPRRSAWWRAPRAGCATGRRPPRRHPARRGAAEVAPHLAADRLDPLPVAPARGLERRPPGGPFRTRTSP